MPIGTGGELTGGGGASVGVPWTPVPPPYQPVDVAANDITANFNAALASLPKVATVPAGNLLLPQGTFNVGSLGVDTNDVGPMVNIMGYGQNGLTTLTYLGSKACILKTNSGGNGAPQFLPGTNTLSIGSYVKELMIDMSFNTGSSAAPAIGLHLSDISGTNTDLTFYDSSWPVSALTPTSIALAVTHTNFWAEKSHLKFNSFYCSQGLFCDGGSANLSTAGFSMQGTTVNATIWVPPGNGIGVSSQGCMGIHLIHGVWFDDSTIKMHGNAFCDSSLGVSYGMYLERANAGGAFARFDDCTFDIAMEADGNGTTPTVPYTIWFDNVSKTVINRGMGSMHWFPGPGGQHWGPSTTGVGSVTSGTLNFAGSISGDSVATSLNNQSIPYLVAST